DIKNFDLVTTVDAVMAAFAQRAAIKNLELVSSMTTGLPTRLRGDPVRLRQVLMNLIGNAIKFTEKGTVRLSITKEQELGLASVLRFSISDTGPGISADQQNLLFKPFSQLDQSTRRSHPGTGLGLAISKQLVERMGGQIGLASA